MDRRNFLRLLVGGVAAEAAVRTFPFRVFSFPSKIESIQTEDLDYYTHHYLTSQSAWYLDPKPPKFLVIPPQLLPIAKEILYG